jgi:integrase
MASYEFRAKTHKARFFFRHAGKQYNKTLTMESERSAERQNALIEETVQDLERGKLTIPEDADVLTFILSGGKVATKPKPVVSNPFQTETAPATIGGIFDTYTATLTPGSKEANSMETEAVHERHFRRLLGEDRAFETLGVDTLQKYADKRAGEGVVRDTIKKELATLRVVWRWAFQRKHVTTPPVWKMADLTLPKSHEKPPFQTWDQITRKIERGRLKPAEIVSLWESLWLDQSQTIECLAWVREHVRQPFLFPMFAFAAFTGARRGEIIRSERDDWDFDTGFVTLRQKKADKSRSFTRRNVPLHPELAQTMQAWFANHPGGQWTIANEDGLPIGGRMATKYFRGAVKGGKWSVLHGWHTFRHSLASNMASAGVDQRFINGILGHSTEEMERRYRHLLPQKQEHALHALFQNGAKP